ncbi:peptidase, M23 family [Aeromicrobium marinum DSM 15272]|uniref:Peptidase, M23 family n=2 Tax=Aeromicrobium marinum TaxID=219314 RepID=E2SFX9_9ACTN|nr:peptidase, M23 family [Aeromicrobium marinum DSM 15272]
MVGALALVVAGIGSAVITNKADGSALTANYQAISAAYTGGIAADDGTVDVSRSFDRELLEEQTRIQAEQFEITQQQLAQDTQAAADQLRANQWVLPVAGYRLSARFGQRSSLWSSGMHTGLDFAGPSGSTIVSVAAGTVISAGYEGSYGNRTVIELEDGTEVWYAHQSRMIVRPGETVTAGQTIGYTGSTGNSTGPHLHLEIYPAGSSSPVDPAVVLRTHNVNP